MFMLISEAGEILQFQSNDILPELNTTAVFVSGELPNPDTEWFVDSKLAPRPSLPEWPSEAIAPWAIPLVDLAAGSTVNVSRQYGVDIVITELSQDWDISDAGVYSLLIEQAFPARRFSHTINIA